MSKHIHAELMLQYAQDAMETDKPWERWETFSSGWRACCSSPVWASALLYRRKPQTVTINGFEVPAPLKVAPDGGRYYIEYVDEDCFYSHSIWSGHTYDRKCLKRGIAHATKEGAIASCKARLGIDPNGDSDD